MKPIDDPIQVLPLLRGCQPAVLMALMMARAKGMGPVRADWLYRATGYSDKPVSRALALVAVPALLETIAE